MRGRRRGPAVPHVFGPQRVGRGGAMKDAPATWKIGRALLQGDAAEAFTSSARLLCPTLRRTRPYGRRGISTDNLPAPPPKTRMRCRARPRRDVARAYVRAGDAAEPVRAAPPPGRCGRTRTRRSRRRRRGGVRCGRRAGRAAAIGSAVDAPDATTPAGRAMRAQLRADGV